MASKCCVLCLNAYPICVNDEDIFGKILKYLQIDIHDLATLPVLLCANCIESIEQFHHFYERVKSLYNLKQPILHQTTEECHKISEEECMAELTDGEIINDVTADPPYVPPPESQRIKCKTPDRRRSPVKKISKMRMVQNEIESFYRAIACPLCENSIIHSGLKAISKHFKDCHREAPYLRCCEKDFSFSDLFKLRRHVRIHTQPDSCICDICGKSLSTPRHMKLHRELHIPLSERTIECEHCGRKCSGNAELYRHVRSIHLPQESVCNICGKEFRRYTTFQAHMKTVHGPLKTYTCVKCPRAYKSSSSLNHHIQSIHQHALPKTKQCSICGKRVGTVYVKNHMLRCHNSDTPHHCPLCDKKFKLPGDLKSHLVSHSEERPYPCLQCESSFKTKAALKSHVSQHTGGKPVKCPYCSKTISCYSNYLAHRRRMHSNGHSNDKLLKNDSLS